MVKADNNCGMSTFARTIMEQKYAWEKGDGIKETWKEIAHRVAKNVMKPVTQSKLLIKEIEQIIYERKFIPAGRYLASAGRPYHQCQNCLALRAEDSREGWADLIYKSTMALMTGAGIGVNYNDIRAEGKKIRKTGGIASGPVSLATMINEVGRYIMQGGNRRGACLASLAWSHPDIFKFIHSKDWIAEVKELKIKDFSFPAQLDGTNLSINLDDDFFKAYHNEKHPLHAQASSVYWDVIKCMCKTGEPGFKVNAGKNALEDLTNACSEFTTKDDSAVCNLGSVNLARITTLEEMKRVVELGSIFLLAGTVYSDVPYPKVDLVRNKNREIGLGLMGLHEWLLMHGKDYGPNEDLAKFLDIYANNETVTHEYCNKWDLKKSIKTRAIAPVGTIGIIGETTTGIEPIFCTAYKRRYLKHSCWCYQYVVDPTSKRLIESGINPDNIEDAYVLSEHVERRVAFQSWIQEYVDMAIASTINMPAWGSEHNNEQTVLNFGNMLINYLPKLRGITVYPDGARSGQPLVPISYKTATKNTGCEYVEESTDVCLVAKGNSCNS